MLRLSSAIQVEDIFTHRFPELAHIYREEVQRAAIEGLKAMDEYEPMLAALKDENAESRRIAVGKFRELCNSMLEPD